MTSTTGDADRVERDRAPGPRDSASDGTGGVRASTSPESAHTGSTPLRIILLVGVYVVAVPSSLIVAAMYGAGASFFADVGDGRVRLLWVATVGMVAHAGAAAATAHGLWRRARWAWLLAVVLAGLWVANGVRVILAEGLVLPGSILVAVPVLLLLWAERSRYAATGSQSDGG